MYLDRENYPEYWPLSIVLAFYCNSCDFSSLIFVTIYSAAYITFLVADTQLYKRLCPSVGRSVGRSVGWSVGWLVGP